MPSTVAVVGGGYGGITAARELDASADVVLVEPRDTFVHHVAALRGLVDPAWVDRIFLPYDGLLERGRVVRDRAAAVDPRGVVLGSGERIDADVVVLATGASYPFPAKFAEHDSAEAKARLRAAHAELAAARGVLLLGAGPVGLELAGEIKAAWPGTAVTVVDPAPDILAGPFPEEFRKEVRRQLEELGVELVLGTALTAEPATAPGRAAPLTAATESGRTISADIWFRCHGTAPHSDYALDGGLASARRPNGGLDVAPDLRLPGHETVFAIGDVTTLPEAKTARNATTHAKAVAAGVRALMEGGEPAPYEPLPPGIVLPLGPGGGASYSPETGMLDAATTAQIKGETMMVEHYRELLGVA
ncbi:NAD(P)/FAD-dependent oxidoreductase [Streptomonospora nanhaiensis]|uniref:NAD(P)/FAD-dependent oxidoreductase n=1 Tax=Streptomonospora nanhaiensis TaxID=1323731 RepID=UPI001C38F8A5|nr:FAD-dependent oxidoreductase [Streptomonospora nanhaiensis]MBV2366485.1 FAD-dependent oxidoreductase [Streptomonospora nanhaiensis]